jgi:hypothetical protein
VTPTINECYTFVFKGLLVDEALDRAGRKVRILSEISHETIAKAVSIDLLDENAVDAAKKMGVVYTAIAAFETSVRNLISKTLLENKGANWWEEAVSEKIRSYAAQRFEDEKKTRWHTQRGEDPITYTTLAQLHSIIHNNWDIFEAYVQNDDWARGVFDVVERSRNVIMHSGVLDQRDIDRLGIYIRDWIKQVGA